MSDDCSINDVINEMMSSSCRVKRYRLEHEGEKYSCLLIDIDDNYGRYSSDASAIGAMRGALIDLRYTQLRNNNDTLASATVKKAVSMALVYNRITPFATKKFTMDNFLTAINAGSDVIIWDWQAHNILASLQYVVPLQGDEWLLLPGDLMKANGDYDGAMSQKAGTPTVDSE